MVLVAAAAGADEPIDVGEIHFDTLTAATEPAHATSSAPVRLRVRAVEEPVIFGCPFYGWNPPSVSGRTITFEIDSYGCPSAQALPPPGLPVERIWDLGVLAAGVYDVVFVSPLTLPGPLVQTRIEIFHPSDTLQLRGEFLVTVARPTAGPLPAAQAVALSNESGYFTFFSPTNVELTVKVLDGRALNGHYWVFIASMTDQPFTVRVLQNFGDCLALPTDPRLSCPWRDYVGNSGKNQNFIDVEFPALPPPPPS